MQPVIRDSPISQCKQGDDETMSLIRPIAFNEPFTIYLDADGKPVQRTLREMTAGEVMQAMQWHAAEADRLEAACDGIPNPDNQADWAAIDTMSAYERQRAVAKLRTASEAAERAAHLWELVWAQIPEKARATMKLREAVGRHWPAGCDSA